MSLLPEGASPGVRHPLFRLIAELGRETFSFAEIVAYVERWRCKPMRIEKDRMPVGMTGYSVGLRDCDLICVRPGLTSTQNLNVTLHELCHFLRGDIALLAAGEKTPEYQQFVLQRARYELIMSRQFTKEHSRFFRMYDDPCERDTETLARICLQCIVRHNSLVPEVAMNVFGGR
jgi:hypothetical protein